MLPFAAGIILPAMPKPLDSRNARILQIRGHRVILDADLALLLWRADETS